MFTLGGLLKLFGDLFAVIGPLAIQQIVQYIENMYNLQYNSSNSNALLQMTNSNNNNITNSNRMGNNNTSITTPEIESSAKASLSTLAAAAATSLLGTTSISFEEHNNLVRNIRSTIKVAKAAAAAATGSQWLPNLNVTENSDNNNMLYNNLPENNTNIYNQMANGIDYIEATSYTEPYAHLYSSGAEVKIYYPSWLDLLSNGWAIAWIVLLAALAQGALSQASTHILNMTGIRIKTSLQGLIYRKTLLLNSSTIGGNGNGNNDDNVDGDAEDEGKEENSNTTTLPPVNGNKLENSVNSNCHNMNSNNISSSNNNQKDYNYLKDKKILRENEEKDNKLDNCK